MSEADKLFEELGYKKQLIKNSFGCIEEYIKESKIISFYNDKNIAVYNCIDGFKYINMQVLKAINLKCKELGWIEE